MINIFVTIAQRGLKYIFMPLLVIVSIWSLYFLVYGNFHKVDKDVYRSAQLFTFNMPYYLEEYKIKSILNLRGKEDKSWYKDEIIIANEYNITHINYKIGDRGILPLEKMDKIVHIIKNAPKPLLVHCKAGADRASLASALYVYDKTKDENPEKGFSLVYGHFPWLGSKTVAMDESFEIYKEAR